MLPKGKNLTQFIGGRFEQFGNGLFAESFCLQAVIGKPILHLRDRVGVIKRSQRLNSGGEFAPGHTIHSDGFTHKGHIKSNPGVVNLLVDMVFVPKVLRHGKLRELLLYLHFGFHVTSVIGFEAFPLVRSIGGAVSGTSAIAFRRLTRHTEILNKVFALGELLLVEVEDSSAALERKRKTHISRPYHRAMPRGGVNVNPGLIAEHTGKTNTLKVCVEGVFDNGFIFESRQYFGRDLFTHRKVDYGYSTAVNRIAEEHNFKIRRFRIAIDPTFGEVNATEGLDINADYFHFFGYLSDGVVAELPPPPPG